MNKLIRRILLGLLAVLVIIQLIPVDRSVPENMDGRQDFITMMNPPAEIATLLTDACYDCHSYKTKYPWYSKVAPVKWWIQDHINEGREHLNFSVWGSYEAKKADHKLEECVEEVEENKMPLDSYINMHPEADLTTEQRAQMTAWFDGLRRKG
ncbi:MAG: heme-binding domain-containing protein [Bacteroidetes bacterium]|nr:heme-binding domain-containing protein [Bacteroidota bacterium]